MGRFGVVGHGNAGRRLLRQAPQGPKNVLPAQHDRDSKDVRSPSLCSSAHPRADRRVYSFLDHMLGHRIPRSYIRFLWFCTCLFIALCSLIIGQGFASVYLSTLPHSSLDGVAYVWCWIGTVQTLNAVAGFVLDTKIRSRALSFVFRFYFSMCILSSLFR